MIHKSLKKNITFAGAFSTVVGTVIGSGIFFKTALVVSKTQSPVITIFVWLLAGILAICGGLTVSELATSIPKVGGPIYYLEAAYGKLLAFLFGWTQTIIYYPATIAALGVIFAEQCLICFHLPNSYLFLIASGICLFITFINLLGTKIASKMQTFSLIIKLFPITVIILFGIFSESNIKLSFFDIAYNDHYSFISNISAALLATLFAYDGWLSVGNIAIEMNDTSKDLPKAIIFGLGLVTTLYLLFNFVFFKIFSIDQIAGNNNIAYDISMYLFGYYGGKLVTVGILVSVYGALNGYIMTGMRVPYALAIENKLPFSFYLKKVSSKSQIPYIAAMTQFCITCIMIKLGSFNVLTDMVIFILWFFGVLIFISLFILRKKEPLLPRPYKVPLYPFIPIIAIIGGLFILVMTILTMTKLAIIGIFFTLIGIPIFYLKK